MSRSPPFDLELRLPLEHLAYKRSFLVHIIAHRTESISSKSTSAHFPFLVLHTLHSLGFVRLVTPSSSFHRD